MKSIALLTSLTSSIVVSANEDILHDPTTNYLNQKTYGTDLASFPIHHASISPHSTFYPSRQQFYDAYLAGCRSHHAPSAQHATCDENEASRIEMNNVQPPGMWNYTDMGFRLVKLPPRVVSALTDFWKANLGKEKEEEWFAGNTYTNHWESPTMMMDVTDDYLEGGGEPLRDLVWDTAHRMLEEWTGQELAKTSFYGIRMYATNAVLAPHVDRMPLVTSAVINVAQDVEEDWVLELWGHDGKAYNVSMEVGDMVMYESHSVIHGRPWPLKGKYFANVFVHFEPIGHSLEHGYDHSKHDPNQKSGYNHGLPPYILDGSIEASRYRHKHGTTEWKPFHYEAEDMPEVTGSNGAHYAAYSNNIETLLHILANERSEMVHEPDGNGWLPIHEAARAGNIDIIKILLDHGADIDARTEWGEGISTLRVAMQFHEQESPIVEFLKLKGAQSIIPYPDEL
ncbi:hypothetical protein ACHAXN_009306 [Cyclotella atomus]